MSVWTPWGYEMRRYEEPLNFYLPGVRTKYRAVKVVARKDFGCPNSKSAVLGIIKSMLLRALVRLLDCLAGKQEKRKKPPRALGGSGSGLRKAGPCSR